MKENTSKLLAQNAIMNPNIHMMLPMLHSDHSNPTLYEAKLQNIYPQNGSIEDKTPTILTREKASKLSKASNNNQDFTLNWSLCAGTQSDAALATLVQNGAKSGG